VTPAVADLVHLLVAAALTYALGFERDLRGAPAGDRVFALIGVGAGIVGVLAVHGAPTALQGALTGIGFIGAGLVFRQQQGHLQMIRGLTTAAAIFAAAAIGAAAGEGLLLLASHESAHAGASSPAGHTGTNVLPGRSGGAVSRDQAELAGPGDGLGAIGRAELAEGVADVLFGRVEGDHELGGDGLVGQAGGQHPQHLELSGGERPGQELAAPSRGEQA
jgi:MgtC family